jgi:hypothetical protein
MGLFTYFCIHRIANYCRKLSATSPASLRFKSHQHAFLVITEGHGNYYWIPQVSDQSREMPEQSIDSVGTGNHFLKV